MAGSWWSKLFGGDVLPGPRGIPDHVGRHLVTRLNKNPDWVWKLVAVVRPRGEKRGCFDVRVFDHVKARNQSVVIRNYNALDGHPDLVLFEGWFDKETNEIQIAEKNMAASV